MGLGALWFRIANTAQNISEARSVVIQGLEEALFVMSDMVGNPGQETVFKNYVEPQFRVNAQGDINEGWQEVDIGEYMDFMGEIVGEGNFIMNDAYEMAQYILSELEEALEAAGEQE